MEGPGGGGPARRAGGRRFRAAYISQSASGELRAVPGEAPGCPHSGEELGPGRFLGRAAPVWEAPGPGAGPRSGCPRGASEVRAWSRCPRRLQQGGEVGLSLSCCRGLRREGMCWQLLGGVEGSLGAALEDLGAQPTFPHAWGWGRRLLPPQSQAFPRSLRPGCLKSSVFAQLRLPCGMAELLLCLTCSGG